MPIDPAIIALLSASVGGAVTYGLKSLWDSHRVYRDQIRFDSWKAKADLLERSLSQFYWPVYLRLQRDNVVWKRILDRHHEKNPSDEQRRQLAVHLERDVILPNHIEITKTIYASIHLSRMDKELEGLILRYLRHVDVYTSMRSCGIFDMDPIAVGEPWPVGLFDLIERRLVECQEEYNQHMRLGNSFKAFDK